MSDGSLPNPAAKPLTTQELDLPAPPMSTNSSSTTSTSSSNISVPANPFKAIGGGLGGLRGLVGSKSALKESFTKKQFTDYDLNTFANDRGKNATERLRELDNFRMHTPLQEEVDALNVTPYRMNLHVSQDVLYLCGGLVGVRFSSEDLMSILKLTKEMNAVWTKLDAHYKSMSSTMKKTKLSTTTARVADCASTCTTTSADTTTASSIDTSSSSCNSTSSGSAGSVGNISDRGESQDGMEQSVVYEFHSLAGEYVQCLAQLQSIMIEKRKGIDPSTRNDAPKFDADPESKMGLKMPIWLSTLVDMFDRSKEQMNATALATGAAVTTSTATATATKSKSRSKIKVGELSVFLSGCVLGIVPCNQEESSALSILIQASNDTVKNVSNSEFLQGGAGTSTTSGSTTTSSSSSSGGDGGDGGKSSNGEVSIDNGGGSAAPPVVLATRSYWSKRFYLFLSKMTELASAIKDEASIL